MTVKDKPKSTGWESIDELLVETQQVFKDYESVREKVDQAQSSFRPKKPASSLKLKLKRFLNR